MKPNLGSEEQQAFIDLLKAIRRRAGLRQLELANRLNTSQSFVSKYESGEQRLTFLEVRAICEACGVDLSDFVSRFQAELTKRNSPENEAQS